MKYYISAPLNRDQKDTYDVIRHIESNIRFNISFEFWFKGSKHYDDQWIPDSEFVVFLLPGNSFEYKLGHLPVGVRKEFKRCRELNKAIFIGYRNREGEMNLYRVSYNKSNDHIKGVPGTTGDVLKFISNLKDTNTRTKEDVEKCWYDPRGMMDKRILLPAS